MKKILLTTAMALCAAAPAFADLSNNYVVKIDWDKPGTLQDSIVQHCDDSYADAIEIVVPGKPRKDFHVSLERDVTGGEATEDCKLVAVVKADETTSYLFDVEDACTVKVDKRIKEQDEPARQAVFELSGYCRK